MKFEDASFAGSPRPSVSDSQFQILSNNPGAAENIDTCTLMSDWNGYLCKNPKIGQVVFESLDGDSMERTISPIHILGMNRTTQEYNGFNNTLNSFMDHAWDGHYTSQMRMSRFPGMIELDKKYELYLTGTHPGNSRYTLEGVAEDEYVVARVDHSQSIYLKVYKQIDQGTKEEVDSNMYNKTLGNPAPLNISNCGESRYEQGNNIYEFVLRRNCTVYLHAQEHLIGFARLQMSVDEFFDDDFINKMAFALGITVDKIRVVSVRAGSAIVHYQIISGETTESSQRKDLIELAQMLAAKHEAGTLDLGYPILDLVNQVISSNGATVTTGTGSYKKKEIHPVVFVLLALSAIAFLGGIIYGTIRLVNMFKIYQKVSSDESVEHDGKHEFHDDKLESKVAVGPLEEVKE